MDGMIKIVNTQEDSKINVYHEKLLQSEKNFSKIFNIYIISKRKVLVKGSLNIDLQNTLINLTTDDNLTISIRFADLLALVIQEERDTRVVFDQMIRNSKGLITEETVSGNKIANLNFYPLFTVSKCNCCGWIMCKCREIITERRAKNIELMIPSTMIDEVKFEINKIMYADRGLMNKEVDVNKKRKLLLYVNPIGGKGSAIATWNRIRNLFNLADIEIDVFRTQHYHHAYEHTLDLNFKKYDGVLCCSGDGIVHEVINAIFHRPDRDEFISKVPVGVIPGGTSNGFAKSICEGSEEQCSPESCSYIIAKGQVKDVDIIELETLSEEKKIYCFLGVAWGIIADIDLESETCRCCGPLRYSIYGAFRWMCLRNVYSAFFYLPENSQVSISDLPSLRTPLDPSLGMIRENDQFYYFWACNISHGGETINVAPKAKLDDGFCDILKMRKSAGKKNLLMQLFNQDSGDYYDHIGDIRQDTGLDYIKTKFWRLVPKHNLNDSDESDIDRNMPRFYSIDGERYPVEPIQGKTLKKSLRIFCLTK